MTNTDTADADATAIQVARLAHAGSQLVRVTVNTEDAAAAVPEVASASVGTLRQRLWKVGAVVVTSARRVWLHVSASWPYRDVWLRVRAAVDRFVSRVTGRLSIGGGVVN